jgi:hypothetical protein
VFVLLLAGIVGHMSQLFIDAYLQSRWIRIMTKEEALASGNARETNTTSTTDNTNTASSNGATYGTTGTTAGANSSSDGQQQHTAVTGDTSKSAAVTGTDVESNGNGNGSSNGAYAHDTAPNTLHLE